MEQKRLFSIVSAYLCSMFVVVGAKCRLRERFLLVRISENLRFYQWIPAKTIAYLSRFGIIKEWFTVRKNRALKTCLMNLEVLMSQSVTIKSNKYGINLILDKDMPFQELLTAIKEKFQESEKFFKNAKMAISFEGRTLTQEEEYQIIETITENTSISIICIVDNDETHADLVKQQIEAYYDSVSGREGEFYRGTLRSGQVLESVSSVVIVGDVNPGAKIISQGNIIVLGALKGNAYAGAAGDSNCFIVALEMDPIQIQIGDILAKSPDKKMKPMRRLRRKEKNPVIPEAQIAVAKGGNIYIEPITRASLNDYTK